MRLNLNFILFIKSFICTDVRQAKLMKKITFCFSKCSHVERTEGSVSFDNFGSFWPFIGLFFHYWDLGNHFLVIFEMFLKESVPSVHSVNLISVVSLTGTVSKISFSPFSESSCYLFDTNLWINSVVSISSSKEIIKWDQITTFSL